MSVRCATGTLKFPVSAATASRKPRRLMDENIPLSFAPKLQKHSIKQLIKAKIHLYAISALSMEKTTKLHNKRIVLS